LFSSSVDYGRLFTLFTLEEALEDGSKKIVARPSPRSVSETEKLLWERFQDYRYIVMHHKVHFYDEVVENILVRLLASGTLKQFLTDLVNILDGKTTLHEDLQDKRTQFSLLESLLLEFDDPWIESRIRSIYRQAIESETNGRVKLDTETTSLLKVYVEDRRRFTSAFKSDEDFWGAVQIHAYRLSALRPKESTSNIHDDPRRKSFASAIYATKFSIQHILQNKFGFCVLIGPTDRKVSYGVRNDELASSFHVSKLVGFLKHKKYDTMLFNLWFDNHSKVKRDEFLKTALHEIEEAIFDEMDKSEHIQEFKGLH
jgi:hypothetical protein